MLLLLCHAMPSFCLINFQRADFSPVISRPTCENCLNSGKSADMPQDGIPPQYSCWILQVIMADEFASNLVVEAAITKHSVKNDVTLTAHTQMACSADMIPSLSFLLNIYICQCVMPWPHQSLIVLCRATLLRPLKNWPSQGSSYIAESRQSSLKQTLVQLQDNKCQAGGQVRRWHFYDKKLPVGILHERHD